jgi:hypothetical protein
MKKIELGCATLYASAALGKREWAPIAGIPIFENEQVLP